MATTTMPAPNFSGTWRFNFSKSKLQFGAPDSSVFVIDHDEPVLRLARTHVVGHTHDTFELELTTDGKEVSACKGDLRIRCHAQWDGETLVFEAHLLRGGETGTNVVRYTLGQGESTLIAEERYRSDAVDYDNTWVLERD